MEGVARCAGFFEKAYTLNLLCKVVKHKVLHIKHLY